MWYANEVAVITGRGTRYRAQELVQLDLSALSELVVIGCGSGRPDMFVGDLTVAHAAALAGASEILYSLWPLRPKHGAEFVHDLVEARSVGAATKEFLASLYANRIVRASPFGLMRASAPTE